MDQRQRAQELRRLHERDRMLVVANAWDAASARVAEAVGFETVATSSSAMAWAHGDADGENVPFEDTLAAVERMVAAVAIPVSVDFESGHVAATGNIERSVDALLDTGAAGFGLEDSDFEAGGIRPTEEHAERIASARAVAERRGIPALIIGRTELFLRTDAGEDDGGDEAIARLRRYVEAGADVAFAPGIGGPELIGRLVRELPAPLNVLRTPRSPDLPALDRLGVRRVTIGGASYRAALAALDGAFAGLRDGSVAALDALGSPSPPVLERVQAPSG
jgi:2-methylisocitrate lyase-like PEP mutase family enzyme